MRNMTTHFLIKKGSPYPLGITVRELGINFAFVCAKEECALLLYLSDRGRSPVKLPLAESCRMGHIVCGFLEIEVTQIKGYEFYAGEHKITDPYARMISKDGIYGLCLEEFDWGTDNVGFLPYERSVFYGLHVKGFTQHSSSKVKARGTFAGIIEKIPYLKELGITTLELMPAYEFESMETVLPAEEASCPGYFDERYKDVPVPDKAAAEMKINYWGYKEGHYFIPKASYTFGSSAQREFKEMVKALHENEMEIVMQFYFPEQKRPEFILEVLRYWKTAYHIDGFHMKGERVPIADISKEPLFADTKLLYEDFPLQELYGGVPPVQKNLAFYRDDFLYDMRRFLKGDEGMIEPFLNQQRGVSSFAAVLHYIANYYGFTLFDLVSYEKKHNEANGENNQDGSDYNISWNCGIEGNTRKKAILELRTRQVCNALCFVFLAQGTPFLMSGDEFGRTQMGNNNPYCQDNELGWVNWNLRLKNTKIYDFVKMLIQFRKSHPLFCMQKEFRMTDYESCGYPDLSYHGEEPWKPNREYSSRCVGILYCGAYRKEEPDSFLYVLYNMHWEKHAVALPKLPKGKKWIRSFSTNDAEEKIEKKESKIELEGRTVCVYIAK